MKKTVSFNGKTFQARIKTENDKQVIRLQRIQKLEDILQRCSMCNTQCQQVTRNKISLGLLWFNMSKWYTSKHIDINA